MKNALFGIFLLNSAIMLYPLIQQFKIIVYSPKDDKHIISKVLFFMFTLCIMAAMWLSYFRVPEAAWFFFLIVSVISAFTYRNAKKPNQMIPIPPILLKFLRETLNRLFKKSPRFFVWWQRITIVMAGISWLPIIFDQFNIEIPALFQSSFAKIVGSASMGFWLCSQLAVQSNPVATTSDGAVLKKTDDKKMPFTVDAEKKQAEKQQMSN